MGQLDDLIHKGDLIGEYDSKFLFYLFKSQAFYGGVTVNEKRYKECAYYNEEYSNHYEGFDLFKCSDGAIVALK